MQLVEFETNSGTKVWVNPEQVIMVGGHIGVNNLADLLIHGSQKPATVKGTPADVAKKLNDGMKQ